MRVVVTGGAGFIGSHLSEALIKKGFEVICIDNLITGTTNNIKHLLGKKFEFIEHDVTKQIKVNGDVDYVLHFASPASPIDYLDYPIQTLKVGSLGTHNAIGLAKFKKAKFLLASTSEVYGDPLVHPQSEDYWGNVNPIGPRSCYDEAKRFAEAITMAYYRFHKVDVRIIRIFNTYGERMRKNDGRVVPNFINQALKGDDITIYGDGNQTRSFCYVSDLVNGICRVMETDIFGPFNLGNPQELKIIDFATKILEITGSKSKVVYKTLPQDDPKIRKPDITRAKEKLGWEPKVGLKEGLIKTIEWFKSN
jgi:dTDP-glucose 4,6-dehydratase